MPKRGARNKRKRLRSAVWGSRKKKNQKGVRVPKKNSLPAKIVYCQWPVINPFHLFKAIIDSGALSLLQSQVWNWGEFWSNCSAEEWSVNHPALLLDEKNKSTAMAVCFHGDEGSVKRARNVLVLSWSSIATHGPSERTKFPFAVSWYV